MHPPKSPSRAKVWGRRQWVHLGLSVVGLGIFVACCVAVIGPQFEQKAHRHGVVEWISARPRLSIVLGDIPLLPFMFFDVTIIGERLIVCTPDGIEDLGDPDAHSGNLMDLWRPGEDRTAWNVTGARDQLPVGTWATTSIVHTITTSPVPVPIALGLDIGPNPPTPAVGVRAAFWDAMAQETQFAFPKAVPTLIAYGKWTGSTIVWSGYAINIATIAGLSLWLWFTPIVVRDAWRAWRRKPHMCAACGYDLRGLAANVCPECGVETRSLVV